MLTSQFHKFRLEKEVTYLNCAYQAPLLKKVAKAGVWGIQQKTRPYQIGGADFFEPAERVKKKFAQLIKADDPQRIAIIPSASYGLANVVNNIPFTQNEEILIVEGQFPSNVYPWMTKAKKTGAIIKTVAPPTIPTNRGKEWNEQILAAINPRTKVVSIGHIHWADGTLFDLKAIRKKTTEKGALLVIDGTQSVGALPFNVPKIRPDALICAAYKWLLGPYSIGLAYYGPYFDQGEPIENNWINRLDSDNFKELVNYQEQYREKANRYSVGEYSNFTLFPMLEKSLDQLLKWKPKRIQNYCKNLISPYLEAFQEIGCFLEDEKHRSSHLFGIQLPKQIDLLHLQAILQQEKTRTLGLRLLHQRNKKQ